MFTVDVVIPARNEARYIAQCLAALQQQDYPAGLVKVYVVDNGSHDETQAIARSFCVEVLAGCKGTVSALRNKAVKSGSGELIAFLDAHCVPDPDWLKVLTRCFDQPQVGGCTARLNYCFTDPQVRSVMEKTGFCSPEKSRRNMFGNTNPYPWIASGNAIYRRQAVEEAGYFNEQLASAEDIDLAWRVVLLGYQLVYADGPGVAHYDTQHLMGIFKKHFRYGSGIAKLAHLYGFKKQGALTTREWFDKNRTAAAFFIRLFYEWGFYITLASLGINSRLRPYCNLPQVKPGFRPVFCWTDGMNIQVSPQVVYWFPWPGEATVVHVATRRRYGLDGVGCTIWRCLAEGRSRDNTIQTIMDAYAMDANTVSRDLDDFIRHLAGEKLIHLVA